MMMMMMTMMTIPGAVRWQQLQWNLIPMTHAPQTGAINRLHFFLALVAGTCVKQILGRIHTVPDSGAD